jgi:hypothetical protein
MIVPPCHILNYVSGSDAKGVREGSRVSGIQKNFERGRPNQPPRRFTSLKNTFVRKVVGRAVITSCP